MTFRDKFLITLLAVLAVLLALAAYGYFSGAWEEEERELKLSESWSKRHKYALTEAQAETAESLPAKPGDCLPEESRERVRGIMLDAIDDALHDHIKTLFGVWMKDFNERGQPSRAAVGARQGIRAHQHSRKAVVDWNPPECPK